MLESLVGQTIGAGLGQLGRTVGNVLSPLDWPRQALYSALEMDSPLATGATVGGGALGALLGGTLVPLIGAPLGAALGAGLTHGIGSMFAPDEFRADTTPKDVASAIGLPEGFLSEMAVGMATDPLTWTPMGMTRGLDPSIRLARAARPYEKAAFEAGLGGYPVDDLMAMGYTKHLDMAAQAPIPRAPYVGGFTSQVIPQGHGFTHPGEWATMRMPMGDSDALALLQRSQYGKLMSPVQPPTININGTIMRNPMYPWDWADGG